MQQLTPYAARIQQQFERRQAIRDRVAAGESMASVARDLQLTRGRIWQIVNRADTAEK